MFYLLIVAGVLILITIILAIVLVFYSRNASVASLKSQNRVKDIIEILKDERANIQRRSEALTALADIGNVDAVNALLALLSTRNETLLAQLALQLPRLGAQIYPALRRAFMKAYNRPGVIRILVAIGPGGAEVVLPLLKDSNPTIRSASLQAIDQIGWKPGNDATSADYWITKRQPENCGSIGPAAVPALLEALKEPGLRPGAIDALGDIGDVSAGWPLLELAKDPKYKIKVIKAVLKWKENVLPLLFSAIKGDDPQIRKIGLNILDLLSWRPTPNEMGARYWVLKHNWEKCVQLGGVAVAPLLELLQEKDKQIQKEAWFKLD